MPTFNQLVRKGRQVSTKKSKAPALQVGFNSLKKKTIGQSAPRSVVSAPLLRQQPLRSLTPLFVRLPEYVFPTEWKLHPTFPVKVTICRSTLL